MINRLSDFPSTHWDAFNKVLVHYTKLTDRTVTVAFFDDDEVPMWIVCLNNINYDITFTDTSHKLYDYIGWDTTLLLSHEVIGRDAKSLNDALETANHFINMEKIPYLNPEYNDTMAS